MNGLSDTELARFWAKVALPDENGCMLWTAGGTQEGYGTFRVGNTRVGRRKEMVHRIACYLSHGAPPSKTHYAAHSCRNRRCVAPSHLRWATPAENAADKVRDDTDPRGGRHGGAKLTEEQVLEILKRTELQRELAREYGVSRAAIGAIRQRRRWTYLDDPARSGRVSSRAVP